MEHFSHNTDTVEKKSIVGFPDVDIVDSTKYLNQDEGIELGGEFLNKIELAKELINYLKNDQVEQESSEESDVQSLSIEQLEELKTNFLNNVDSSQIDEVYEGISLSQIQIKSIKQTILKEKEEQDSNILKKKQLEAERVQLREDLRVEEKKSFVQKVFSNSKRIKSQIESRKRNLDSLDYRIIQKEVYLNNVERTLDQMYQRREGLVLDSISKILQDIAQTREVYTQKHMTEENKGILNDRLIKENLLPQLKKLQREKGLTDNDSEEYLELLRFELREGKEIPWNAPLEVKELGKQREERRRRLEEKFGYNELSSLDTLIKRDYFAGGDIYYDQIFDLVTREILRKQLETIKDDFKKGIPPSFQEKIEDIADSVINPFGKNNYNIPHSNAVGKNLDISYTNIEGLLSLKAFDRWSLIKDHFSSGEIIPEEIFNNIEEKLIRKFYEEALLPGGRESTKGTIADSIIEKIGNPKALPYLLKYVEKVGSGHTSSGVVGTMVNFLRNSNSRDIEDILQELPLEDRYMLEILKDEDSYLNKLNSHPNYFIAYKIKESNYTVTKEKLSKVLKEDGWLEDDKINKYYLDTEGDDDLSICMEALLRVRDKVEKTIIDSKIPIWIDAQDKLLAELVDPKNGDTSSFPIRIIKEGLNIFDESMHEVVEEIFSSKRFRKSFFERQAFVEGLVFLNSKHDGGVILEKILSSYNNSKEEPSRARRILQYIRTIDNLSVYKLPKVGEDDSLMEIFDLEKDNSLKEIEDSLKGFIVDIVSENLDLDDEVKEKIGDGINDFLKSDIFQISLSLAGGYEAKDETGVKKLLSEITGRIIKGDFKEWRYSHIESESQLSGLNEEQKDFWKSNLEHSIKLVGSVDEIAKRKEQLNAVKEIVNDAKSHILESMPDLEFSKQRVLDLANQISVLTEDIRGSDLDEEKKNLISKKRFLEAEYSLISGILEVEDAKVETFTQDRVLTLGKDLSSRISELNLPLAGVDIEQLGKVFTVGDLEMVRAYESDDPITLLKVGTEPRETCQSWRGGGYNECLLAYVADSNKKVLNIEDSNGKVVARSILKLTNHRDVKDYESKREGKTLFVEPLYTLLANPEVHRAFVHLLLEKAQGLNVSLTFGKNIDEGLLKVLEQEAEKLNYGIDKNKRIEIYIPKSLNMYEYSDLLGGKIIYFNRYQPTTSIFLEKKDS